MEMSAASSTNSASLLTATTSHEAVASTITTSSLQQQHQHPTHIIMNTVLPPATTLRGSNGPIIQHSMSPETCHHITLTDVKSTREIVPVLVSHSHQHHSLDSSSFRHDVLADSSTLIEAASPMITTTSSPADMDHQTVLSILNECSSVASSTTTVTTVLMQPTSSSSSMHPSTIIKTPTSQLLTSLPHHNNNNNGANSNAMLFDETGSVIGINVIDETLASCPSSSAGFLPQCSSNHLNSNNSSISVTDSRVFVNQSPQSVSTMPVTIPSESRIVSNVNLMSAPSDNNIHNVNDDRLQLQLQPLRENKSCSTDTLNSSASNESTSSSAKSDIDEGGGYQDNTSSNSQQSGGGGSVSGGTGNGNGNYVSLIQPSSIGQSGIAASGHSTSGNLAGGGNMGHGGGGGGGSGGMPGGTGNGPHYGASGQTGGMQSGMGEQTDFKYLFEELCPVCGDKVSGYHYGLLTCESCKGFFKRTVQNKKVYTCVAERRCLIDKTQRKRCPYCRFQKCLDVGMKLEAVRADRMRGGRNKFGPMYKRDRARKLQMMRQRQLALQAIRGSMSTADVKPGQISPTGYQQSYPSMNIKQEIQIPQVSSLTQSPDSSPSPIAIALGQVNPNTAITATTLSGSSTNTTTVSGAGGGSGSCGPGSDNGSSSLQHSSDSKICFDSGTNPSSTADSVSTVELRVSPMIREFVQSVDDREWQTQLFTLLQKQSYNQVEVDLFELMCKVLDQNLFSQVDWARNTIFFKDLKVDDQMKLLQFSWSDMLVLDHLHQRIHNGLPDETPLHNGQIFNLLNLGLLGVPQLGDYFNELQNKLQELKFDMGDYVCMKFLILLNPNVRGIVNRKTVLEGHENVQAALLDYTLTCYPSVSDKFSRLLNILPEIHAMATRGEEHLYIKHCTGSAPTQTLLMEMLHAKRKV